MCIFLNLWCTQGVSYIYSLSLYYFFYLQIPSAAWELISGTAMFIFNIYLFCLDYFLKFTFPYSIDFTFLCSYFLI